MVNWNSVLFTLHLCIWKLRTEWWTVKNLALCLLRSDGIARFDLFLVFLSGRISKHQTGLAWNKSDDFVKKSDIKWLIHMMTGYIGWNWGGRNNWAVLQETIFKHKRCVWKEALASWLSRAFAVCLIITFEAGQLKCSLTMS